MRKLYLKQTITQAQDKFTFYDDQQQKVYQGQQTSMSLPPRFGLVDCEKSQQVVTLDGVIFSLMPEFKLIDNSSNNEFCKIRKKFTMGKPKVIIKSVTNEYLIDGDFVARDFKILDDQQQIIIKIQPTHIAWGEVTEVEINCDLIAEHIAAGMLVGIECAYYSDNKY